MPGGGVEPPKAEARRILSTQVGSDPFGKFSTLLDFSMAYKPNELRQDDPICTVLMVELLQFYYSVFERWAIRVQLLASSECNRNLITTCIRNSIRRT